MKKFLIIPAVLIVLIGIGFATQEREPKQEDTQDETLEVTTTPMETIEGYTKTDSGLQYLDEVEGDGAEAAAGSTVSVHYTGTFEDGEKFDSSVDRGEPFEFPLGGGMVIQGWDEGVVGMKVGGKRKLVVPPELGYGPNDYGPIPGGSVLYFDVELLEIK